MKKENVLISAAATVFTAATAFTNLYCVLDELSKDEYSLEASRASQFKKYMEIAGMHNKEFLHEFIKNDIWRN